MQAVMTMEELHHQWNVTRSAFYRDPSDENEEAMDRSFAALIRAKGEAIEAKMAVE